jgi:hypothetical protein
MSLSITSAEGVHRLSLQCAEGHFQALVWTFEANGLWECRVVITRTEFERGAEKERWVSELHSFDPASGTAIVKVGEMEVAPEKAGPRGFRRCLHSWREWSLLNNKEVRLLRRCEDPNESYDPTGPANNPPDLSPVTIDCREANWDGRLYVALYNRRRIELITLHSSYEGFLVQLADAHHMKFIPEFENNRGTFEPLPL